MMGCVRGRGSIIKIQADGHQQSTAAWHKTPLYLQNFIANREDVEEGQDNTELKEHDGPSMAMK